MSAENFEQELTQFKKEFYEATQRKDRPALERMFHDGFIFVDPEGDIVDKPHCIFSITHPDSNFTDNFKRVEKKVSTNIEGNVITEVADVELIGTLKGQDRTGLYINTCTYVKGPNGWQILGNTLKPGQSRPGVRM